MRQIVIHGHFYQPPREEPWLELVPRELTAAPDHDWNERITRQCYRPLARGRVFDAHGRIIRLINCYAWCSFDVGPTLFRWFDQHAPDVGEAIVAADRASAARLGEGNALAMPYHHVILPLMSRRDKLTEVRWGIRDFRARFGREPAGMWLPETAVDEATLEVLAQEGIRFTVLAPGQVESLPPGATAGRWRGAAGRELAVFVYNGPAAHHVAFGDALDDAERWASELLAFPTDSAGNAVVSLATDGETFGHHHVLGDLALAGLIDRLSARDDVVLTNYAALLQAQPPTADITVVSPSSWSCPHGVDRWCRDDGCRFEPHTSQAWRAPVRQGLQALAQGITASVQQLWPSNASDIWIARDVAGHDLAGVQQLPVVARMLLEAEQHSLAMFTSCAWFFDDLGRLEPQIVLRHAARALDLLPRVEVERLEPLLLGPLAQAHSNDPGKGSGLDIWNRDVVPFRRRMAELAAGLAAVRDLSPDALDDVVMPAHRWILDGDEMVLEHKRTGQQSHWRAEAQVAGVLAVDMRVRAVPGGSEVMIHIGDYPQPVRDTLRAVATPMIYDAAMTAADVVAWRGGLLHADAARAAGLRGAWLLVARDGVETAGIVVHGVLDLFDLDGLAPNDEQRADAWQRLVPQPPGPVRDLLATRFAIELPAR
jgi:hypothetical protein